MKPPFIAAPPFSAPSFDSLRLGGIGRQRERSFAALRMTRAAATCLRVAKKKGGSDARLFVHAAWLEPDHTSLTSVRLGGTDRQQEGSFAALRMTSAASAASAVKPRCLRTSWPGSALGRLLVCQRGRPWIRA